MYVCLSAWICVVSTVLYVSLYQELYDTDAHTPIVICLINNIECSSYIRLFPPYSRHESSGAFRSVEHTAGLEQTRTNECDPAGAPREIGEFPTWTV